MGISQNKLESLHSYSLIKRKVEDAYGKALFYLTGAVCPLCGCVSIRLTRYYLCSDCLIELFKECAPLHFYMDGLDLFSFFQYKGMIRALICNIKFKNCRVSAIALNRVICDLILAGAGAGAGAGAYDLSKYYPDYRNLAHSSIAPFCESFIQGAELIDGLPKVVSIPCSATSIKKRGWDPVQLLVERMLAVGRGDQIDLLKRSATQQQKKLKRKQRLESGKTIFELDLIEFEKLEKDSNFSLLFVDDVMTTGATLLNASGLVALDNCIKQAFVLACD